MKSAGLIGLSLYGFSLVGGAFGISAHAPKDDQVTSSTAMCIRDQFACNGFIVSRSGDDSSRGSVSGARADGPHVTVSFRRDIEANVRIGDPDGNVPIRGFNRGAAAVQGLTEDIATNCLRDSLGRRVRVCASTNTP